MRATCAALLIGCVLPVNSITQTLGDWPQHSTSRPAPVVIDPGPFTHSAPPPSDAVVLFDGRALDAWTSADNPGQPATWTVAHGYMEIVPGSGNIQTTRGFGDVQLHVEWAAPTPANGEGQARGNSGVILMARYEVQVLDSYDNPTYADGQSAAIYGQYPPLVNASRPPGEWQTYDIMFRAPRFDAQGAVLHPARFTVLHNIVLVHDNVALVGPTAHRTRPPYEPHAERLPLVLQDHGDPVRYRNIWLRDLGRASL